MSQTFSVTPKLGIQGVVETWLGTLDFFKLYTSLFCSFYCLCVIKYKPFTLVDKVIPGLHNDPLWTLGRKYEVDEKTLKISDK